MESILLHGITPEELKDLIVKDLKKELELILNVKAETTNYSVQEVADLLGCSVVSVYNYIKRGSIPAYKLSRRYIIKKSDLDNVLKEVKSLKYRRD
ncbi:helix-turn-helix domain-containing protein [Aestuariibaculum sp. M13]|uniref:helix-turn-helix domain-containing protein n=1 Tax=Aestuariibaculum sp. M13 TaxID=2967132 RepID=UPI002159CEB6|nr:helix-turn-helix domain-containing protein [Aestuariibaculum sp. M13]MCR8666231.1 helix-turn-helix domain-containing protein [Aestuariibaculum sp. M13]